ncbi:MAG: DUF1259 domain-containing protein [Gemmatimonadaceae bacterium]
MNLDIPPNDARMSSRYPALAVATALLFPSSAALCQAVPTDDWTAVNNAIGRAGSLQADNAMKFSFPRRDLDVTLDGVKIKPALALGSWVAFKRTRNGRAMVMGDLVLTAEEVGPVVTTLEEGGVNPSAVHNHLLGESPRIVYVHIAAAGEPVKLATVIRAALGQTKTPPAALPPTVAPPPIDLDTGLIHQTLGNAGKVNGGVYQVSVPRPDKIRMGGDIIPPSMGVSTAINFQPTGGGRAAITGDFVMEAKEVDPILRTLRSNRIAVTALHSHMVGETPRLYFMHFWANDNAATLASTIRRALNQIK